VTERVCGGVYDLVSALVPFRPESVFPPEHHHPPAFAISTSDSGTINLAHKADT
jgi:hypothetical protein